MIGPRRTLSAATRLLLPGSTDARAQRTTRALSNIFASFINHDGIASHRELEIVYDFERNLFPELDHGIIGRFLENAVAKPQPVNTSVKHLKKSLSPEQKTAFALQLFSVVRAGGTEPSEVERFQKLISQIANKKLGFAVIDELSSTAAPASDLIQRLDFGTTSHHQVQLPQSPDTPQFRCYLAGGMILARNLSQQPLIARGQQIPPDQLIQIRPSDELLAGTWRLTYQDLSFFLQNDPNHHTTPFYLIEENGELILNRARSKSSLAKISFHHQAHLTPLQDNILSDANQTPLTKDNSYSFPYHEHLHLGSQEPVTLESLRKLTLETGQRFVLPKGRRKVRVSNDPSKLSGDSLLLTPGLAGRFLLELDFDPATGQGELNVVNSNQTILADGIPIKNGTINHGTTLRLSSRQSLRCLFSDNILDEERNLVRYLQIQNLNHSFRRGRKAIDSLSLHLERGQMMCIIGPSGSGKSTLLEVLAGQRRPTSGHIRLNNLPLYENQKRLSPLISFMPQEESLSSQLNAREHLAHAASIRRPHLTKPTIQKRVNYLLDELGLDHVADRPVGRPDSKSLSGGERSRLNAGLDLIGGGEIFLFDEPISGLSSKDAEHVITSLHGFARDKIVVASLHRPSDKVLNHFDLVLLLDQGGKMAYFGPPKKMIEYFQEAADELDVTYSKKNTASGADFVFDILETPMPQLPSIRKPKRRFQPDFWQERFENRRVIARLALPEQQRNSIYQPSDKHTPAPDPPAHGWRQKWNIFKTHLSRAAKSKLRHQGTWYAIFLEAPLLAALIGLTLRASASGSYKFHSALHLPSYLFLSVTVAMFFGLTNSATEILRDRPTLRRERNCRPHSLLYLISKFLTLTATIALQSAIFILTAHSILEIHDLFWPHLSWMILTGCCGIALALFISVITRSERTALGSIPLILVPQILLAGALIPFSEMNRGLFIKGDKGRDAGHEPVPSTIMPLRYAYEGAILTQAENNRFEETRLPLQNKLDQLKKIPSLSQIQQQQLSQTSQSIRTLFSASANSTTQAQEILKDPLKEYNRLLSLPHDSTPPDTAASLPISQFYINQRINNLVEMSESLRLDSRRNDNPHIFLAKKKPLFGLQISTQWYCRLMLALLTILFLILASKILKRSLTRH